MNARTLVATAAMACAAGAWAQSSVTISGTLDVGYHWNSNAAAGGVSRVETRHEPSFVRFSGVEDLGGGLQARFALDMGVQVDSGSSTGFSRESSVGLSSSRWGSITLGRQYDTMIDLVGVDPPRFNSVTAVHVGNWDRSAGNFLNNMIKYRTPNLGGFIGTVMYSPKEDGSSATNSGKSSGASGTYISGPLRVSAAVLRIEGLTHRPLNETGRSSLFGANFATTAASIVTKDTIGGIGAYYDVSGWRVLGEITRAKLEAPNGRTETYRTVAAGVVKTPNTLGLRPGVGMNYTALSDSRYTSAYAILDYYFSRRTDAYIRVITQRAKGPAGQRAALYLEGPSSKDSQTVVGIGVTHRF